MQSWELGRLSIAAAHDPEILCSEHGVNRVLAILLAQGECLQEHHEIHEPALIFVTRGLVLANAGSRERRLPSPSLLYLEEGEQYDVRAITECQMVLCLAPWSSTERRS
jgi:5-deoxy-D-glucuronate isomerase